MSFKIFYLMTADTSNKVYNYILKDRFFEYILSKYASGKQLRDELRQIVWVAICNIDEKKIIKLWNSNQFKYFYIGIVKNQIQSKTSPLHRNFRLFKNEVNENDYDFELSVQDNIIQKETDEYNIKEKKEKLEMIEQAKAELLKENPRNFVYIQIFDMYFAGYSFRKMSDKLKLPKSTCFNYTKKAEKMIKDKLKDIY